MTDDINNSNVVDDNANDVIQSIESSLDQNEGPAVDDVPTSEKMLTQTEVNSIVGSAKQKGFNKGYQEALTELSKMNFQPEIPQPVNNVPKKAEKATGSKSNLTPDEVQKMISESMMNIQQQQQQQALQQLQQQEAQRILSELTAKVTDAQGRYNDYDDVTSKVDFSQIPEILEYANHADNAGDVLYDLAKNPAKIATLRSLTPDLAVMEINRLSNSIKSNQNGTNQQLPKEPLSQVQSSNVGTDNGKRTLKDFKRQYIR